MADISKITTAAGRTYNIKDSRIADRTESANTFLRGDGEWAIPSETIATTGVILTDGGDFLRIEILS